MNNFFKILLAFLIPYIFYCFFEFYFENSDFTAWWPFFLATIVLFSVLYAWIYDFFERLYPFKKFYTNIFAFLLFSILSIFIFGYFHFNPDYLALNEGLRDLTFYENIFHGKNYFEVKILLFMLIIHIFLKIYKKWKN